VPKAACDGGHVHSPPGSQKFATTHKPGERLVKGRPVAEMQQHLGRNRHPLGQYVRFFENGFRESFHMAPVCQKYTSTSDTFIKTEILKSGGYALHETLGSHER